MARPWRTLLLIIVFLIFGLLLVAGTSWFWMKRSAASADQSHWSGLTRNNNIIVLVSIDGLRPDVIEKAGAENLSRLMREGSSTRRAQTIFPSWTVPAHVSLVTGVTPEQHGVKSNRDWPLIKELMTNYIANQSGKLPTILDFTKGVGMRNVIVVTQHPEVAQIQSALTIRHLDQLFGVPASNQTIFNLGDIGVSAPGIGEQVRDLILQGRPTFIFVHFYEVDQAGHHYGWFSPAQYEAVRVVDAAIGMIMDAMRRGPARDRTYLFVTSDHGGHITQNSDDWGHGTDSLDDMVIPIIVSGPDIKKGYDIHQPAFICDIPATILHVIGVKIPENWDGKSIKEIFVEK